MIRGFSIFNINTTDCVIGDYNLTANIQGNGLFRAISDSTSTLSVTPEHHLRII